MSGNVSSNPFAGMKLRVPLRGYQQQIIDDAPRYMADNRLHIVAPPGAGKTIIGLELIRSLGRPTLILAPTVSDCQQWISHFESALLSSLPVEQRNSEHWVSRDIHHPRLITCVTYQALHAFLTTKATTEDENLALQRTLATLRGYIGAVCLDEAHHLRLSWQITLQKFLGKLPSEVVTIALTATPPYDVSLRDFQRYLNTCGPIDQEIYAPTLVASGDMCPHQDFIYFTYPTRTESNRLVQHHRSGAGCVRILADTGTIRDLIEPLGVLEEPGKEEIVQTTLANFANGETPGGLDPAAFTDLFVLGAYSGLEISPDIMRVVLGGKTPPYPGLELAQRAFQFALIHHKIFPREVLVDLQESLRSAGALQSGRVELETSSQWDKTASASSAKFIAIASILQAESENLGTNLRLAILTEHVRIEALRSPAAGRAIAAVPIFEYLRPRLRDNLSMALLSGSIVIVPRNVAGTILDIAKQEGVEAYQSEINALDEEYVGLDFGADTDGSVTVMTKAFEEGWFNVLIGTSTLLGDSWNAPCVNSIILAAPSATYNETNQMRGRAVRTDPADPYKVANIWHLVTLPPPEEEELDLPNNLPRSLRPLLEVELTALKEKKEHTSRDWRAVRRQFLAFLGPSATGELICSGSVRLAYPGEVLPPEDPDELILRNEQTMADAANRQATAQAWNEAIQNISEYPVRRENRVQIASLPIANMKRRQLRLAITASVIAILTIVLPAIFSGGDIINFLYLFGGAVGVALLWAIFSYKKVRRFSAMSFHLSRPHRFVTALSKAVAKSLVEVGEISPKAAKSLALRDTKDGYLFFYLNDAETYEHLSFGIAMQQIMRPIERPRYVLARRDKTGELVYAMSCPEIFAASPKGVQILLRNLDSFGWFGLVGINTHADPSRLFEARQVCYGEGMEIEIDTRRALTTHHKG